MSNISDIADKLVESALQSGEADVDDLTGKLIEAADKHEIDRFTRDGARRLITGRLRTRTAKEMAARFSLQPDLFDEEIHAAYPVDGEDGRKWKVANLLSELECESVVARLKSQRAGIDAHLVALETAGRVARPVWRLKPKFNLGEALAEAAKNSVAAE